jgi:hypothetical protein
VAPTCVFTRRCLQVQAAAHGLQQQQAQQQQAAQQPPPRLEQLAAAAQLQPRQVLLGLAAARRQRLASFSCVVPVETAAGACSQNKQQQLAPFGDVQREEGEEAEVNGPPWVLPSLLA